MVKASASRAEDPGFDSHLRWDFFGFESYQWLKNCLVCSFYLSLAAHQIVCADLSLRYTCMWDVKQPTNQQIYTNPHRPIVMILQQCQKHYCDKQSRGENHFYLDKKWEKSFCTSFSFALINAVMLHHLSATVFAFHRSGTTTAETSELPVFKGWWLLDQLGLWDFRQPGYQILWSWWGIV